MGAVIIGMDPHKRSATIEVIDERETVLAQGRFGTDTAGYRTMLSVGRRFKQRIWAVEGCNSRRPAHRPAAGRRRRDRAGRAREAVRAGPGVRHRAGPQDRPGRRAQRRGGCAAGQGTSAGRRRRRHRGAAALVDRRDRLGQARTETISRLHTLLLELVPGGAKKYLSAPQARALLGTVRPRDIVGRTRRQLASELITELAVIDKKIKDADRQLTELVQATGSTLQQLHGIGPSGAARLLGDIADIARFATCGHFASWNGTAPLDASSGEHTRHRLSRAGNRRINRVLHIMASVTAVSSCATTPKGAATTGANSPPARPRWKPCAA